MTLDELLGPRYFKRPFQPGKDKVYYAMAVYGDEEIEAVVRSLKEGRLGMGDCSSEFAKRVAKLFGKKHGVLLNSGSSATYLALKILDLEPGSEVITSACTFATTLAAILNNELVPVVADSKIGTYNLDLRYLKRMLSRKTRALLVPHVLGNLNDMEKLAQFAKENNLFFIEDSCDQIGGRFKGKPTGFFSDITLSSFYASHHITAAGGGGILCTDDEELAGRAVSYRDWGRMGSDSESVSERFKTSIGGVVYDQKFTYSVAGFNFRPIELQAAFGLVQLKKLSTFNRIRRKRFQQVVRFMKRYERFFWLPQSLPEAKVYWLAFPLTLKDNAPFHRLDLVEFLETHNIQTRLLFTGNVLQHPAFQGRGVRVVGSLKNADKIMKDTILIGCHHGMNQEMLNYLFAKFKEFLGRVEK